MVKVTILTHPQQESQPAPLSSSRRSIAGKLPKGWKFGAITCATTTFIVFLLNLGITIWIFSKVSDSEDGAIVLFDGGCDKANRLNLVSHIFINILSTILLSSSNYCMQCLSAPTRRDLDEAHQRGEWLDVGVVSLRNLRRISKRRRALWGLLALSSLPIHLFFNSVLFTSISVNEYDALSVTESFINDDTSANFTSKWNFLVPFARRMRGLAAANQLEQLDPLSCINAYASKLQSERGGVLVVTNSSAESYVGDYSSNDISSWFYSWICGDDFTGGKPCLLHLDSYRGNISSWNPFDKTVKYCLSERLADSCRLNSSLPIAVLVTVLNLFKALAIVFLIFYLKESPILTIGDAISSYLETRDPTTEGMCLVSKISVERQRNEWSRNPIPYQDTVRRWYAAISLKLWVTCILMYSIAGVIVGIFLHLGISRLGYSSDFSDLVSFGLGTINPVTIIQNWPIPSQGASSIISNVLIANIGQTVLSFLYITYNNLFTIMFLAHEWSTYATQRKSLRVSTAPQGAQKSSYFLQLPYRFALPLMGISALVHWLLSQAIFLVAIQTYEFSATQDRWVRDPPRDLRSCGYSPLAIILFLVVGFLMLCAVFLVALKRLRSAMPIAGSCSVAISAACHPKHDVDCDGREMVTWGVVDEGVDGVGHCAFSNADVSKPRGGSLYAG